MQIGDVIFAKDTPKGRMVITLERHMGALAPRFALAEIRYGFVRPLPAPETVKGQLVTHSVQGWGKLSAATGAAVQAAFDAAVAAWTAGAEGRAHALSMERDRLETAWELAREAADEDRRAVLTSALETGVVAKRADRKAEIAAAYQALVAFDTAHPEIAAAVKAQRARYIPTESID